MRDAENAWVGEENTDTASESVFSGGDDITYEDATPSRRARGNRVA